MYLHVDRRKRLRLRAMHWLLSPVDALLFPAPKATYSTTTFPWPAANCLWLEDPATGNRFPAVVCEPTDGTPPVRVILYCHGNACDAAECYNTLSQEAARWRALLVIVEFPGYGVAGGPACAEAIDRHVRITYEHFTKALGVHPSRVVVFGCSVGTGPASKLAASVQADGASVGALILQSPYTSVRDAAAHVAGSVAYLVVAERWDNTQHVKQLTCPVLIVHGTRDEVIPYSHGQALCALRQDAGLPIDFFPQEGGTHNVFRHREDLSQPVADFLRRVHPQGSALAGRTSQTAGSAGKFWAVVATDVKGGDKDKSVSCWGMDTTDATVVQPTDS